MLFNESTIQLIDSILSNLDNVFNVLQTKDFALLEGKEKILDTFSLVQEVYAHKYVPIILAVEYIKKNVKQLLGITIETLVLWDNNLELPNEFILDTVIENGNSLIKEYRSEKFRLVLQFSKFLETQILRKIVIHKIKYY